jgi:TonB family protein
VHTPRADHSSSNEPSKYRLVIRARIISEEDPQTAPPQLPTRVALMGVGVAVLLALSWLGITLFKTQPPVTPTSSAQPQEADLQLPAPGQAAPVVHTEPRSPTASTQQGARTSAGANSSGTKAVESAAPTESAVAASAIDEVIPDTPRSALQTIRGTIKVSIRVTVDNHGRVLTASSHERGPSRYFERLSLEAARKWTFTPADTAEPRSMLLQFHFTRDGATASAGPLP